MHKVVHSPQQNKHFMDHELLFYKKQTFVASVFYILISSLFKWGFFAKRKNASPDAHSRIWTQ